MDCPSCHNSKFNHDKFEDMYCCLSCGEFFYPQEVGVEQMVSPGYIAINTQQK